jgi:phosphopantothenoylcysteine decarboxylase/phosphopantothenate--cysteine ligase|tara:strand:+ start:6314 stop:7507 length:1194 start_codon:yes stop_codon:yes gene_type:complete
VSEDTGVTVQGPSLDGKRVILAVSGGIAATESIKLARELRRHGAAVHPIMSKSAEKIISPLALSWGSGDEAKTEWDPEMSQLSDFDGLILAPATRNSIAKFTLGLLDSPMMMALSAAAGRRIPMMFVPSMHNDLFHDAVTTELISSLEELGVEVLLDEPSEGRMKQPSATKIVAQFCNLTNRGLENRKRVAVTLGGNVAPIDSVRSIVNISTGRTGWAIAEHLHRMGHDVVCLAGHTSENPEFPLPDVRFSESPGGMLDESIHLAKSNTEPEFWVHAAAVLDYEPEYSDGKMPSGADNWNIKLQPTKKHLQVLKEHVEGSRRIGFKLEVGVDEETLISKSKNLISDNDLVAVVANLLDEVNGHSKNRCRIVFSNGAVEKIQDLSALCHTIEGIVASK